MNIVGGRHLAAVMFADVVGYTSLMQRDERAALAARRRHRAALHETVPAHGGRIFQFLGDGSVSLFPSAVEAVRAAIDIQRLLAEPPPLPLRLGIEQGEVTYDEQGILGDAVNVAARVQALSVPGAVLVTGKIRDELRNQPDLPLVDLGRVRLKGVQDPVALHAVAAPGLRVPAPSEIERSGERAPEAAATSAPDQATTVRAAGVLRDRIAAALDADYAIEGVLDAGGMGLVFRGRDRVLDRPVAVKVMRPELTTERAIERFLREARILARLRHPAIVPVHRAGDADGLPFYVMDFLEGETLEEALRRGPMPEAQVMSLARSLLDGLSAVHAEGVVHRDIKPSNVFLTKTGAVLTDFGIARTETASTGTGSDRPRVGTPGYMPPEQEAGHEVTQLTDIYAAGMIFYEALAERRWSTTTDPADADWAGVPNAWIAPLRRALGRSPPDRWPDALAFSNALSRRARRPPWIPGARGTAGRGRRTAALTAIAVVLVTGVVTVQRMLRPEPPRISRLAVFPFEARGDAGAGAGQQLTMMVLATIRTASGLSVASAQNTARWWARSGGRQSFDPRQAARDLNVEYVAVGDLLERSDSLILDLTSWDSTGAVRFADELSTPGGQIRSLADRVTGELLDVVDPRASHRRSEILSADDQAWFEFVLAERDVVSNDWQGAAQHYERAIARDSSFVTARWLLVNAQRWLPLDRPWIFDPVPELEKIAASNRGRLGELDSLLLAAQLSPRIRDRLDRYRAAVTRFPDDGFAALLYGDELFHRGALAGRPVEDAANELQRAVALQRDFAPAYAHLAWLYVRRGDRDAASAALEMFRSSVAPQIPEDLVLIDQAFLERFDTAAAVRQRARLFGGSSIETIDRLRVARIGLAFDLPAAQYELGTMLAMHPLALPERKANGYFAIALSLLARGHWRAGLAWLDTAAILSATEEATLQSAEWRVIPAALGFDAASSEDRERGRAALRRIAGPGPLGDRAAWALAIDDIMEGDTAAAAAWLAARPTARNAPLATPDTTPRTPDTGPAAVDTGPAARRPALDSSPATPNGRSADPDGEPPTLQARPAPLASLRESLEALLIAARGELRDAIDRTDPSLERDHEPGHGDPFVRALLHSSRARWYERLAASGQPALRPVLLDSARREWIWAENLDLAGWVTGSPQSAEVDWVLSPWASASLARLEEDAAACRHARRALDWWSDADSTLASAVAGLRDLIAVRCALR